MRVLTFITSTLIFTAAGVGFGMLFALQNGSKNRCKLSDISDLNDQYNKELSIKLDHFIDEVSGQLKNVEKETKRLAKKV